MEQQIRFCTAPDGVRLAYAIHGNGPPLVRAATWLTHLDFDWESPVWRHWLHGLGNGQTVVRYDERGCGLSDREVGDLSLDAWVADLETVADAAGLDRFSLLGVSGGAATAVVYAALHPERVTHLILYGGFVRGRRLRRPEERLQHEALIAAIRAGWADPDPTFRHVFSMLFLPHGTPEQMAWYDDLQRRSTSAATAVRLYDARGGVDVAELAPRVTARTLVVHAREDRVAPVDEGRLLAALIPGARLVLLESANHILLSDEPAWSSFLAEVRAFLGTTDARHYLDAQLWADDLAAVIDRSGLERPVLVAWSYGGFIVTDYVRAYGEHAIGGINLVGGAVMLRPPTFDHIGPGFLENAPGACGPDLSTGIAAIRRFLEACTARPLSQEDWSTALCASMVVPPEIRGALIAREIDGDDVLSNLSVPVLVTHGRCDAMVLPSMAEHVLDVCDTAEPSWYDGVGHMPFAEDPVRFDRELGEFVDRVR